MSTTDTIRAAFEAAYLSANGFHTKAELANEWKEGMLSSHMFRAGYQAATEAAKPIPCTHPEGCTSCNWCGFKAEAAKATGTAGELPPLPKASGYDTQWRRYTFTEGEMRAYGQQCAEAARQPAPVVTRMVDVEDVKQLCRDYSSRTGSVYIGDVEAALDGLAALTATAAPVLSGKPKEGEKGWRPACCDGGGEGSPCCDFGGCAANNELAEMREEANRSQP